MTNEDKDTVPITLATTDKNTYVPNSDLWKIESDVLTVESTESELLLITSLDLEKLKPTDDNDTREIVIYDELDGSVKEFGTRFWQVMRKYKDLDNQLSNKTSIEKIEYSDRYLLTPLTTLLLGEIIYGLKFIYDSDWTDPKIIVRTTAASNDKQPCRIQHNWKDSGDQERVQNNFLEQLGLSVSVQAYNKKAVNHRRHLKIFWSDSSITVIVLDQGVGFIEASSNYRFNFDASSQAQAIELIKIGKSSLRLSSMQDKADYIYIRHSSTK